MCSKPLKQYEKRPTESNPPASFSYNQLLYLFLFAAFFGQFDRSVIIGSAGSLQCAGIPAIQVMGNIMAIAAFGETRQHSGRMWRTVTSLTGRNGLVFILMTGYTVDIFVFRIGFAVQLKCFFVTGGTHFIRRIRSVGNCRRHMGLVTAFAFSNRHIRAVWLVTLGAERNFAVDIVTETAGQIGVLALDLLQFDNLLGVAGQTFVGDIVGQLDDFGGMRIGVTAQAP